MSRRRLWNVLVAAAALAVVPGLRGQTAPAAQAPAGGEVFLVAYVDILPAARDAAAAAFKAYRDATVKGAAGVRVEVFEQVGRPGHYSVLERWPDQAALDTHRTTPHARQLQNALQAIRVSGYDERPYKALSAAGLGPVASGRSVFVVSHVDIAGAGNLAGAPDMLRRLADESRREPGNQRFEVMQHAMRANHFTVVEAWRDQAALDAHVGASHTKAYRDAVQPISGSPLDERVYAVVN
jgi:quinol monooxygenase YgiN